MKNLNFNDDPFELVVTTKDSEQKVKWQNLFSNKAFVVVFQPGAGNPAYNVNPDAWMEKGLGGCTNEANEFGNLLDKFAEHKLDVFIVNSLESQQQRGIIEAKKLNANLKFISDYDFDLAHLMGVEIVNINETKVHKPTIGIYNKFGTCIETINPQNKDCKLAKRQPVSGILQSVINVLGSKPVINELNGHEIPSWTLRM